MTPRVAVTVFPGTNSEEETVRILVDCGLRAEAVHWSRAGELYSYDAYVLPGGFAYEDRIRAGAIAAHDRMMDSIIEAALAGKPVLGICNGAQILLESGLVPGTAAVRTPTAAFTHNAPVPRFVCRRVWLKAVVPPERCALLAALPKDAIVPAWAAHGQGRLVAADAELDVIRRDGHLALIYVRDDGEADPAAVPNGSALACAGLTNRAGNVLAIMPHPERDAWNVNHPLRARTASPWAPSGGSIFFAAFAAAVREGRWG